MKKVTFTIIATAGGYTKKLTFKGKKYIEEWQLTPTGSKCITKKSITDHKEIPEEIADVVDSFAGYELMDAFNSI